MNDKIIDNIYFTNFSNIFCKFLKINPNRKTLFNNFRITDRDNKDISFILWTQNNNNYSTDNILSNSNSTNIEISNTKIYNSGNDCIDTSFGDYFFDKIILVTCNDGVTRAATLTLR